MPRLNPRKVWEQRLRAISAPMTTTGSLSCRGKMAIHKPFDSRVARNQSVWQSRLFTQRRSFRHRGTAIAVARIFPTASRKFPSFSISGCLPSTSAAIHQRVLVIARINSQFTKPRLEGSPLHPELGSRTISACNLAVNLLENVDDVVSFDSLKGQIDLGSSSSERRKQELHFAMRGYFEHHCPQPCDASRRILERKVIDR